MFRFESVGINLRPQIQFSPHPTRCLIARGRSTTHLQTIDHQYTSQNYFSTQTHPTHLETALTSKSKYSSFQAGYSIDKKRILEKRAENYSDLVTAGDERSIRTNIFKKYKAFKRLYAHAPDKGEFSRNWITFTSEQAHLPAMPPHDKTPSTVEGILKSKPVKELIKPDQQEQLKSLINEKDDLIFELKFIMMSRVRFSQMFQQQQVEIGQQLSKVYKQIYQLLKDVKQSSPVQLQADDIRKEQEQIEQEQNESIAEEDEDELESQAISNEEQQSVEKKQPPFLFIERPQPISMESQPPSDVETTTTTTSDTTIDSSATDKTTAPPTPSQQREKPIEIPKFSFSKPSQQQQQQARPPIQPPPFKEQERTKQQQQSVSSSSAVEQTTEENVNQTIIPPPQSLDSMQIRVEPTKNARRITPLAALYSAGNYEEVIRMWEARTPELQTPGAERSFYLQSLKRLHKYERLEEEWKKLRDNNTVFNIEYNIMIDFYCKQEEHEKMLELYYDMLNKKLRPDLVTYTSMIEGFGRAKQFAAGWTLFLTVIASNFWGPRLFNAVIDMCGHNKAGSKIAQVEAMMANRVEMTQKLYETLIEAYARVHMFKRAAQLMFEASSKNIAWNPRMCLSVLSLGQRSFGHLPGYTALRNILQNRDSQTEISSTEHATMDKILTNILSEKDEASLELLQTPKRIATRQMRRKTNQSSDNQESSSSAAEGAIATKPEEQQTAASTPEITVAIREDKKETNNRHSKTVAHSPSKLKPVRRINDPTSPESKSAKEGSNKNRNARDRNKHNDRRKQSGTRKESKSLPSNSAPQ